MATNKITWVNETIATIVSTELNSLGVDSASTVTSSAYDNETNQYQFASFEALLDYGTAPAAEGQVSLYWYPSIDNSTFMDSSQQLFDNLVGHFSVANTAAAARYPLFTHLNGGGIIVPLPPFQLKWIVVNNATTALAASGSTIRMRPFNHDIQAAA